MRLDKFLKVSRLVKRRTVANNISDLGRVFVNGNIAKPAKQLKTGDIISFKGKYLGKTTYITSLLTENTIPNFEVYAENLRVIGHED